MRMRSSIILETAVNVGEERVTKLWTLPAKVRRAATALCGGTLALLRDSFQKRNLNMVIDFFYIRRLNL